MSDNRYTGPVASGYGVDQKPSDPFIDFAGISFSHSGFAVDTNKVSAYTSYRQNFTFIVLQDVNFTLMGDIEYAGDAGYGFSLVKDDESLTGFSSGCCFSSVQTENIFFEALLTPGEYLFSAGGFFVNGLMDAELFGEFDGEVAIATPIPAAAWLMFSGLFFLFRLKKRL